MDTQQNKLIDTEIILQLLDKKTYYEKELPSIKWSGNKGMALCPFHDDHKPSLSINAETGQFHCFGCENGGSVFDFHMLKYDLSFQDALQELANLAGTTEVQKSKIVDVYNYTDESGATLFQVVRNNPKGFHQRRPDGNGGYIYDLNGITTVPYNLPEVITADMVYIVEGEKDVETLRSIGLIATTNPMGAGKWKDHFDPYFKDKDVVILPDNDDPGRKHAESVARNLTGIARSIKVVDMPDLPQKGDVTDFLKDHTKEELLDIIEKTELWPNGQTTVSLWDSIPSGADLQTMEIQVEWVVEGLIPKASITTLTGRAGIGKTCLLMGLLEAVSKGEPFLGRATIPMPTLYVDFENPLPVTIDHTRKMHLEKTKFWHSALTPKPPKLDDDNFFGQYLELPPCLIVIDSLRASQSQDQNFSKDMAKIMDRCKELRNQGHTVILILHTLKGNETMFSGSQTQEDQADHPLYMFPVTNTKDGKPTEVDSTDEMNEMTFFLGTTYKSRYSTSSHLYLKRAGNGRFIAVPDPKFEKIIRIWEICHDKPGMNQTMVIGLVGSQTGWSKDEISRLLNSSLAKGYWTITKGKRNNEKLFSFSVSVPYKGTENQKTESDGFLDISIQDNNNESQHVDNKRLSGFSDSSQKTGYQYDPDKSDCKPGFEEDCIPDVCGELC